MIQNYHVLFVHFPAALLPLYALMELIRFRRIMEKPYWFYIKAAFSIIGMLTAHIASGLGETIEESILTLHPELKPLIEVHSGMAALATLIFTILGIAYVVGWLERERPSLFAHKGLYGKLLRIALRYSRGVLAGWVSVLLSLAGLVAIVVTGALGGAIVHGPTVDPIVGFIYRLFV